MNQQAISKIVNEIFSTQTMTLAELFEHPFSKIAISTAELLFRTSQKSIKYAKGCVATSKRNDPAKGRWTFSVKCHLPKSRGPYDVRFKLIPNKGRKTVGILGREIEISCNCNAWKYNGADNNALTQDYSERQYSNGQPAHVRDPQRRYLICKHVAAAVPIFKRFIIPAQFKIMTPRQLLDEQPLIQQKDLIKQKELQKEAPKPFIRQPMKKKSPITPIKQIKPQIRKPFTRPTLLRGPRTEKPE